MSDADQPVIEAATLVGVRELRGELTRCLRAAREGASILVTSHDEVIASLGPPPVAGRAARKPGALRGRIRMAASFDTLPDDALAAMEG